MRMGTTSWPRALAAAALMAPPAFAAGGHHGVDDASILPAGRCEQETWASRASGERLLHLGVSCGVGPVELGAAVEHARGGGSSQNAWNLEVKWARPLGGGFSIGIDLQPGWASHQRPRYAGTQLVALATWAPRDDLALHANAGRDFVHRGPDSARGGASIEWSPSAGWWLVAERYLEQRTHFARAGVRWVASERWTLDASRTQRLAGPLPSNWTIGLTYAFGD